MPVAVIMDFAGGDSAAYDTVIDQMGLDGRVPEGAIFHAAGPTGDGWRVVDVWEDLGTFQQFAEEKIGPLTGAAGLPEPSMQVIEVAESFDERDGGTGGVTLLQVVRLPGVDEETFRDADSEIRDNGQAPEGCMFHVNGPSDGDWVVVDAWTDKDTRDAFAAAKIGPVAQSRGITPTIEDLQIHNTLAPR